MVKTPLFSIIVPLFNKEPYLEACLESIKNQTEQSWECIVIDDGSTDNSVSIARKFEKNDARFKVLRQKNAGPSVARNYGIRESRGELLHFMDADDYYPILDTLKLINDAYSKDKPMAISGNILIYNTASDTVNDSISVNSKIVTYQTFEELQNDYYFTRFFFNRKFILKNDISFPEYTYVGEDPVFLVKALSRMDRFLITNIPVYTYRQVAGSGSELSHYNETKLISYMTTQLEILEVCQEKNYSILKKRILDRIDQETLDLYMQHKDTQEQISEGIKKILSFVDAEIHHERIINARDREAHIHNLKMIEYGLRNEIDALRQPPGIKTATRSLIGALRRRLNKLIKSSKKV